MLLSSATASLAQAIVAGTFTPLNNTNAKIGVGDSTTAAAKTQTDLQASTNKTYIGQDASYPSVSGSVILFQITAGAAVANYVWNEFLICDAAPGNAWARFVQPLNGGVAKAPGQSWTLQVAATVGRNDVAN